jgi:putative phosphoesterase
MAEFDLLRIGGADQPETSPDGPLPGRDGAFTLLVVSDTHGERAGLAAALNAFGRRVDLVVHLGDGVADLSLALGGLKHAPEYEFVCGSGEEPSERQAPRLIEAGGAKLLLLHGHQHRVRESYDGLLAAASAFGAGIVLFGHSHEAVSETRQGVLLLNPGSLGKPKKPAIPTFALLTIRNGRAEAQLYAIRTGWTGAKVEACAFF